MMSLKGLTSTMTKDDHAKIAEVFRVQAEFLFALRNKHIRLLALRSLAYAMADMLGKGNLSFNKEQFLLLCELEDKP